MFCQYRLLISDNPNDGVFSNSVEFLRILIQLFFLDLFHGDSLKLLLFLQLFHLLAIEIQGSLASFVTSQAKQLLSDPSFIDSQSTNCTASLTSDCLEIDIELNIRLLIRLTDHCLIGFRKSLRIFQISTIF